VFNRNGRWVGVRSARWLKPKPNALPAYAPLTVRPAIIKTSVREPDPVLVGVHTWLTLYMEQALVHPVIQLEQKALVMRWSLLSISRFLQHLRQPIEPLLDQLVT
jgi:hypothetical protein